MADLTRAAEIKPDYTVPISNRVLLYEQTKQYDLAFADYDKLLTTEARRQLLQGPQGGFAGEAGGRAGNRDA